MSLTEADVQNALKNLIDRNTQKDFVSGKSVKIANMAQDHSVVFPKIVVQNT